MEILLFLFCHWYLSLFFQTFFLHRYASHKMFKMHPLLEKLFFFMTFIFQGSSFLNPAAYGVMHRRHHSYADTPEDPHSPLHTKSIILFNWNTIKEYRKLVNQFKTYSCWLLYYELIKLFPLPEQSKTDLIELVGHYL